MEQIKGSMYPNYGAIRDYISSSMVTIANLAAETTAWPAASGLYHDVYRITCTNSSNVAVMCQVRNTTGGSTVAQFTFPASTSTTYTFNPPLKQTNPNTNWTITGTYNAHSNTSLIYILGGVSVPTDI